MPWHHDADCCPHVRDLRHTLSNRIKHNMNFAIITEQAHRIGLLIAGILLLAYTDYIVLEHIYKPLSLGYDIPESAYCVPGSGGRMFWWHAAFLPLGVSIFLLMGVAARDWRLAMSGMILFATGWEDVAYYAIQGKHLPLELAWLDPQWFVAWTKLIAGQPHVTRGGVWLSACLGGGLVGWLLMRGNREKRGKK